MKVESRTIPVIPEFVPVEVKLTLETQSEYNALFAICNWNVLITDVLHGNSNVPKEDIKRLLSGLFIRLNQKHPVTVE